MSKAENFIQENIKRCSDGVRPFEEWLTPDQAREAVEIARKEMIEWIEDNIEQYPVDNWDKFVNSLITDLKQAMKDE